MREQVPSRAFGVVDKEDATSAVVVDTSDDEDNDKRANKRRLKAASTITTYPPLCGQMTKDTQTAKESRKKDQHKDTINGRNESKEIKSREELN